MIQAHLGINRLMTAVGANLATVPAITDMHERPLGVAIQSAGALVGIFVSQHESQKLPEKPSLTRLRAGLIAGAIVLVGNVVNTFVSAKTGTHILPLSMENYAIDPARLYDDAVSAGIAGAAAAFSFSEREVPQPAPR
jgi:hypothetical protein